MTAAQPWLEPARGGWPENERRAFIAGQMAVLRKPRVHSDPTAFFKAVAQAELEHGRDTRHQCRAGADWELQDLLDAVQAYKLAASS